MLPNRSLEDGRSQTGVWEREATYLYDALNRVTSESTTLGSTPTLATTTFAYNSAGFLSSQTDALGRKEYFYYDALNRMTSQTWYDASGNLTQTFTSTFDAAGDLTTATNNAGTYTMTYDALQQVSSVQEPNAASLTFAYDGLGNRNEMQEFISGSQVGTIMTNYDGADRLTSANLTTVGGGAAQVTLSYNTTNGMIATESRSNGSGTAEGSTSYLYDAANRITGIDHFYASGTALASFVYSYDAASRISSVTENGTLTASYTYNGASELTKDGAITYAYDAAGNRTQAGTQNYGTPAAGNEVTNDGTWTYTYDKAGNMTGKVDAAGDTWSFTYDNANHMLTAKEVNGATTLVQATYTYDYFGNLLSETYYNSASVGGSGITTTVDHAWDMWNPANSLPQVWADQGSGNAVATQYLRGDQPNQVFANISSGGTVSWILTDYLGSTRYVTNAAGTSINDTIAYDAWGDIKSGSTTSTAGMFLYAGMLADPADTELCDANNRWYSVTIGTWTTRDPLGFAAGSSNQSEYVGNSPTNFTDPSGLIEDSDDDDGDDGDCGCEDQTTTATPTGVNSQYTVVQGTGFTAGPGFLKTGGLLGDAYYPANGMEMVSVSSGSQTLNFATQTAAQNSGLTTALGGWLLPYPGGSYSYIAPNTTGIDSFSWTASNSQNVTMSGTVSIQVVANSSQVTQTATALPPGAAWVNPPPNGTGLSTPWTPSSAASQFLDLTGVYYSTIGEGLVNMGQGAVNLVYELGAMAVDAGQTSVLLQTYLNSEISNVLGFGGLPVYIPTWQSSTMQGAQNAQRTGGDAALNQYGVTQGVNFFVAGSTFGVAPLVTTGYNAVQTGDWTQYQQAAGANALSVGASYAVGRFASGRKPPGATKPLSCFTAGTLVATNDGLRAIETIRPDDRVWAFDLVKKEWRLCRVRKPYSIAYKGTLVLIRVAGETTEATYRHPYWVVRGEDLASRPCLDHLAEIPEDATMQGRWVDSCDLRIGDEVLLRDGQIAAVEKLEQRQFEGPVYNMQVEELECYSVGHNSVLVHNNNGQQSGPANPAGQGASPSCPAASVWDASAGRWRDPVTGRFTTAPPQGSGAGSQALDQLDGISQAQQRIRSGSDRTGRIIDSTEGSRQTVRNQLNRPYDPRDWD